MERNSGSWNDAPFIGTIYRPFLCLKRIKLLSSSSSHSGPSTQSTQQADSPLTPETDPQTTSEQLEPSYLPPAAPPPNVEPYDNAQNPPPAPILRAEQSGKRERWAELKVLASVLGKGLNSFGPLKQAVDGIVAGIEIFEVGISQCTYVLRGPTFGKIAAENRTDYEQLENDLNGLFHDLAEFFEGSTPPVMTPSITNLAQGIDQELESVRLRLAGTRIGTCHTDADRILEHYRRMESLLQRISMNVNLNILRLVNEQATAVNEQATVINEQATENRLKSLPNSPAARYNSVEASSLRDGCTKDTRIDILEDLYEWACDDKSQQIYWLNGMAGTGKTTIAYSLCERLETSEKLAASFFCSRQLPTCRNANWIIPTVSYQLSRFSYPFRSVVSQVLEKIPDAHNRPMLDQLQRLIAETLDRVKDALPTNLVIVIDALDECDDSDSVDRMLHALLKHVKDLPVKFFVASRPDPKILDRMRSQHGKDLSTELRLHELGRSIVQEDIRRYLTARLSRPRVTLSAGDLDTLVKRSGVLFIYASTVVRYIGYDNFSRAGNRLKQILTLTKGSSSDSEKDINVLYSAILAAAFDDSNLTSQELKEMKLVLDTVVCALEPLSIDVMAGLLGLDAESVRAALRPLFSVLHVLDATQIITTLHESFPDYLVNRNRSGEFHCDVKKHNTQMAQLCFEQMKIPNPPFNICNLKSSYVRDEKVPDLPARVEKAISQQLLYACRYWVAHCMSAEVSQDLVSMLREFASERFLLWMEVMSLSGIINEGVSRLREAQKWSKVCP
ncbi:hypothetical protein FRC12_016280 [Ceratobasidium sp. 428]|nr:hypothetical protein FRC12_016280 [Ceratobasidium sp. 428]